MDITDQNLFLQHQFVISGTADKVKWINMHLVNSINFGIFDVRYAIFSHLILIKKLIGISKDLNMLTKVARKKSQNVFIKRAITKTSK